MDELWREVRARIDEADLDGLADLLAGAGDGARAALLAPLEAHPPAAAEPRLVALPADGFAFMFFPTPEHPEPPGDIEEVHAYLGQPGSTGWEPGSGTEKWVLQRRAWDAARRHTARRGAARAMAIAACTAKAADVIRAAHRPWSAGPALVLPAEAAAPLLRVRGAAWCTTLARGMARRARSAATPWPFTEALLRAVGEGLPDDPAAVAQYVSMWRGRPLAPLLAADPWFDAVLPYLFDDDRVAAALVAGEAGRSWPPALLELAAIGRVPRATLIAGCLRRLLAGGRPGLLQPYVALLTGLEPRPGELDGHRAELAGLLSAPGSTVAGLAHAGLLALHDEAPLDAATIAEVTLLVLSRPEKKLVRAHLAWLRRQPLDELLPELTDGIVAGLHHPATELAAATLDLVAPRLTPAAKDRLRGEVAALDGEIAERLAALLGATAAAPPPPPPLVADPPAAMPGPLDLDGLATELAVWLGTAEHDPIRHELLLDGLARAARGDRGAAVRALGPVRPRWPGLWPELIAAATGNPVPHPRPAEAVGAPPLSRFVHSRLAELAARLATDPPPALLATPATVAGHVDPERVLALLAAAEQDGRQPGPADLTQALLRMPREIGAAVRAGADRLASPAGLAFAQRLHDGPPEPVTWIEDIPARPHLPSQRVAMLEAAGLPEEVADPRPAAERVVYQWPAPDLTLWPMITPSHPEVAAAHLQPQVAAALEHRSLDPQVLAGLAAADGPDGPAMALVLAYTLANHRTAVRIAAGDAVLARAARPGWDGREVGAQVAALALADLIVLGRIVAPLTEALRGGAHDAAWQIAAAALPPLLAAPPRPGVADLIDLAVAAARAGGHAPGTRPAIPGLAVAATGRTALAAAAKRLAVFTAAG
ncbi:hypothetical protein [Dactylosporangium sp. NPDC048998]|uniref:hypothetical protein n=1 Tax=Dactylosporangium sp. NPDC048998 TaxID=3363976 RepID=UPI003718DBAC